MPPSPARDSALMSDTAGKNIVEWSVSELSAALKRTVEDAYGFVRVRGEVSGFKGPVALRPLLFPPQGRQGGARRRDLEGRLGPHAGQARRGPRRHRVRQAHDLRRLVEIPARDRHAGARRRRRADEAPGGAQEEARRRRPVRRSAQAAHSVFARSDRRGDVADRRRHPRHSASAGRPLSAPRAGVAGAGAGRGFRRRGRQRHQRLQRAAGRRRCRGRT